MMLMIGLLGIVAVIVVGLHMVLRPSAYVNRGTAPIRRPDTARTVGSSLLVIGAIDIAFLFWLALEIFSRL